MGRNLVPWKEYYDYSPTYLLHKDMARLRAVCKRRNTGVATLIRTIVLAFLDAEEAGENLTERHLALLQHVLPRSDVKVDISFTGASGSEPVIETIPLDPATEVEVEELHDFIAKATKALDAIKGKPR
jgi:hypothetical protein